MAEISNDYAIMSYNETLACVCRMFNAGVDAIIVLGMPGCGKTSLKNPVAKGTGLAHTFQLKMSHHEVYELAGLPVPDHTTKLTHQYPSGDMLPPSDLTGGLLMLHDEVSDQNVPQMNVTCQMVYEQGLHNYRFPHRTKHLLTGNRVSDRSGANRIITKLGNRGGIITMVPTTEELFTHGAMNGWNPSVLAFIKMHGNEKINPSDKREFAPTFFNSFDPSDPVQMQKPTFSCSRSLEFLSDYCNYVDAAHPNLEDGTLIGESASLVGSPTAVKFVAARKIMHTMPDVPSILKGKPVPLPDRTDVMWSLALTLASKVDQKTVGHAFDYLDRGSPEFLSVFARVVYDTMMPGISGPEMNRMIRSPKLKSMFSNR
jgi:hypothetical protein